MAERARLSAPEPEAPSTKLPVQYTTMSISTLLKGERRMEAENYLVGGYGLRLQMEAQPGIAKLSDFAQTWQPSRLKGIQVGRRVGMPFLAATQVFDVRPVPRKFLALEQTEDAAGRQVESGQIVVTCSGTVGRVTTTHEAHSGMLISHDLLRVTPRTSNFRGWIFAYLRTRQAREMMTSAQYGHIIKHLETQHLDVLPIPLPIENIISEFESETDRLVTMRSRAHLVQRNAEQAYSNALGGEIIPDNLVGRSIPATSIFSGRRRLEGAYHEPFTQALSERMTSLGLHRNSLREVTKGVYWIPRFKRIFGDKGVPYFSADELFALNVLPSKRVMEEQAEDPEQYRVKEGWIIMACSGQIYGLNGSCMMITKAHESAFLSHDLVRIIPDTEKIKPGYLLTVLSHPTLGRPLVVRNAYGTSIPHLDPSDVADIQIPRLDSSAEKTIAELAQEAVQLRMEADIIENELTGKAERLVDEFLSGDKRSFQAPY